MHDVDICYSSCGCNRNPHALDWGNNGLICYGAHRAIALCQPRYPSSVICTLVGHLDKINSVKWIRKHKKENEIELISGSTDKTAIVWRKVESKTKVYAQVAVLRGHVGAVTTHDAVYVYGTDGSTVHRTLVATASTDSSVKVWERKDNEEEFFCNQTLSFGTGFALTLAWLTLPGTTVPLLAIGGDDHRIRLFVEENTKFIAVQTLVGHEDWIRHVDLTFDDSGDILLASCSQDTYIRIWRISSREAPSSDSTGVRSDIGLDQDIKLKENTFSFLNQGEVSSYTVTLESVLQGHDNWIYRVHWQPAQYTDGKRHQELSLLSASMDKTVILWQPDADSGIWLETVRVGEIGGDNLGFYGAVFGPDGKSFLAHGFQGSLHLWEKQKESLSWEPAVTVGGHFESVEDLAWDPENGSFLLSVSLDQTTRLHGYWKSSDDRQSSWHELARPQIHGYDMKCIGMINRFAFISGADEKVLRVFEAPGNFIENLGSLCQEEVSEILKEKKYCSGPEGASVPALGLSNKAVFHGEEIQSHPDSKSQYTEIYFSPLCLKVPPTEENLLQNTLWPEVQKLYGHGYEIFSIACHPQGRLVATACKAAKAEHAAILLWNADTWRQVCKLESHSLTVTQLAFSHSGDRLLSVSRDRTWAVFEENAERLNEEDPLYVRVAFTNKQTCSHGRIIWGCSWSHDDLYFVTVSRDKKVIIWGRNEKSDNTAITSLGNYEVVSQALEFSHPVTAVDFAPLKLGESYVLALGLENGFIYIYKWTNTKPHNTDSWKQLAHLDQSQAHHQTVKRIKFRPKVGRVGEEKTSEDILQLASCGSDHIVRIYSFSLT